MNITKIDDFVVQMAAESDKTREVLSGLIAEVRNFSSTYASSLQILRENLSLKTLKKIDENSTVCQAAKRLQAEVIDLRNEVAELVKAFNRVSIRIEGCKVSIDRRLCGTGVRTTEAEENLLRERHSLTLTDDGFLETRQSLENESDPFRVAGLAASAISAVPDVLDGIRRKRKKLKDRLQKQEKGTPEYETVQRMSKKMAGAEAIINDRCGVVLDAFGKAVHRELNAVLGSCEIMAAAVEAAGVRRVAKSYVCDMARPLAGIDRQLRKMKGEK